MSVDLMIELGARFVDGGWMLGLGSPLPFPSWRNQSNESIRPIDHVIGFENCFQNGLNAMFTRPCVSLCKSLNLRELSSSQPFNFRPQRAALHAFFKMLICTFVVIKCYSHYECIALSFLPMNTCIFVVRLLQIHVFRLHGHHQVERISATLMNSCVPLENSTHSNICFGSDQMIISPSFFDDLLPFPNSLAMHGY